jgi:hypothetical protein
VVQFTVFDGATSLGTYSANGNDTFDSSGVLSFESALATGSDVITSVVFDDSAAGGSNNLAFGPVTYDNGPVATEPPTLITLGVGLISCGLLRRRRIAQ